jgi:hypothetical protein
LAIKKRAASVPDADDTGFLTPNETAGTIAEQL